MIKLKALLVVRRIVSWQILCMDKCVCVVHLFYTCARGGFRGGARGPVPPFKILYIHVTSTINSMKILFSDV